LIGLTKQPLVRHTLILWLQNIAEEDGRKPLARLAEQTEGFNGSDLLELCSRAAALTVQEHLET